MVQPHGTRPGPGRSDTTGDAGHCDAADGGTRRGTGESARATVRSGLPVRRGRANLNRELVGQGIANVVAGAVGWLPVTGVIVRSLANIRAGARTRVSAVPHGLWILLFVVVLAGVLRNIPLAARSGLLVYVGARLMDIGHIKEVVRHGDLLVYLSTLVGVVGLDLLTGMLIGVGVAVLLMLRRLLWTRRRRLARGRGRAFPRYPCLG